MMAHNLKIKIIDDYLKLEEHILLKTELESDSFAWYFQKKSTKETTNKIGYHFGHNFYIQTDGGVMNSNRFDLIRPIIKKLNVNSLVRVKANLYPISKQITKPKPHTDQPFKCKIGIYYVNTNNGYNIIGKNKVESVQNRMVIFNNDLEHFGTNCTDQQVRLTINFNYF